MAEFLSDVAEYLADQGLGNTTGSNVDIFVANLPDDPANCIALFGLQGGQLPNPNVREFFYQRFQVIIRNTDYETGGAKMMAVRNALHVKIGIDFDNFKVLRCHAQQDGGPIGQDKKGRFEFSINFDSQSRQTT